MNKAEKALLIGIGLLFAEACLRSVMAAAEHAGLLQML